MKKFLNFLAILVITLIPVIIAREQFFNTPNDYPLWQWLWVVLSFWVLAPILVRKKDTHVGIKETDDNTGNYHGVMRWVMFLIVMIIWALIYFLNG